MEFARQPVVDARTHQTVALELLARPLPDFNCINSMVETDLAAMAAASVMHQRTGLRIHANVDWIAVLLSDVELLQWVTPGVVVELTERRNQGLTGYGQVVDFLAEVRHRGGLVALDDVSLCHGEVCLIEDIRPDILKIDFEDFISAEHVAARSPSSWGAEIVVERIETAEQAATATARGATHLQGYLFDTIRTGTETATPAHMSLPACAGSLGVHHVLGRP